MDPAHVDALIGSATETEEDEEELVVVEERTDSGSPTSSVAAYLAPSDARLIWQSSSSGMRAGVSAGS